MRHLAHPVVPQEYHEREAAFGRKYEVYFRLHQLIEANKKDFAALRDALRQACTPGEKQRWVLRAALRPASVLSALGMLQPCPGTCTGVSRKGSTLREASWVIHESVCAWRRRECVRERGHVRLQAPS